MKWLLTLFLALIGTSAGIMLTDGSVKHVFQFAFFGVLVLSFLTLTMDIGKA